MKNKNSRYIYVKLYIKPAYQKHYNKVRYVRYIDDGKVATKIYKDFMNKAGTFYTVILTNIGAHPTPIPVAAIKSYEIVDAYDLKKSVQYYLTQEAAGLISELTNQCYNELKANN